MAHQKFHGRPAERARRVLRSKRLPCWLCGKPIDYTLGPEHPMSFTLDHEVSQKFAPELVFHPSNHKPAHRSCNSSKGTGDGAHLKPVARSREW